MRGGALVSKNDETLPRQVRMAWYNARNGAWMLYMPVYEAHIHRGGLCLQGSIRKQGCDRPGKRQVYAG